MDRTADPGPVQARQQGAGVAIAEIGLGARRRPEPRQHLGRDAAGAVTAAAEPDRIERRVVGDVQERLGARRIRSGEVAGGQEALRMEDDLDPPVRVQAPDQGGHGLRVRLGQAGGGGDDPDPDAILSRILSTSSSGKALGMSDTALDRMIIEARTLLDRDKRAAAYLAIQKRINDQAYVLDIYQYPLRWEVWWRYVKGYVPLAANIRSYVRTTWIDK